MVDNSPELQKVMAGQLSMNEFLDNPELSLPFMTLVRLHFPNTKHDLKLISLENLACAWITKTRFNESMSDKEFYDHVCRADAIFNGDVSRLTTDTKSHQPGSNDTISLMWGMEALCGRQTHDKGSMRIRLRDGVAPRVLMAFENSGAQPRANTHAQITRFVNHGLGRDIQSEELRKYTPRGFGNVLMVPTAKDPTQTTVTEYNKKQHGALKTHLESKGIYDFDLLLKKETYGIGDTAKHTAVHCRLPLAKMLMKNFDHGDLVQKKSALAKSCESIHGTAPIVERQEHMDSLRDQHRILLNLLQLGKSNGLFDDFEMQLKLKLKPPGYEFKITGNYGNLRSLGDFLRDVNANQNEITNLTGGRELLDALGSDLLHQAENEQGSIAARREGDEVIVDASNPLAYAEVYAPIRSHANLGQEECTSHIAQFREPLAEVIELLQSSSQQLHETNQSLKLYVPDYENNAENINPNFSAIKNQYQTTLDSVGEQESSEHNPTTPGQRFR